MSMPATPMAPLLMVPVVNSVTGGVENGTPDEGVTRPKPATEESLDNVAASPNLQAPVD